MPSTNNKNNNNFRDTVHEVVRNIPPGSTMSYKEVATQAGNPKAARAVASLMARNYNPNIPCHRVIRSDGSWGGYNRGGAKMKERILLQEKTKNLRS